MSRRIGMGFDWQGSMDRETSLKRAQIADEVGIDSLWVAEAWGQDAFTTLVQLAERTSNVQVATGIVNIYSRTPAALGPALRHDRRAVRGTRDRRTGQLRVRR